MKFTTCLLAWLCAAACAPAGSGAGESLRLISSVRDCEFGQTFVLTVERAWKEGAEPPAWDPASVAPLELDFEAVKRNVTDGVTRETQLFRARSFTLGTLAFPPHFDLVVRSGLRPDDPGQPEAPEAAAASRTLLWFSLLALIAGGLVLLRRRGRTKPSAAAAIPRPTVAQRLQELQAEAATFPAELTEILRDWLAARAGIQAPGRMVEELLAADAGLPLDARAQLHLIVKRCEELRYAGREWSLDQRRESLAAARVLAEEQE
jgi:hypothetical protein